MKREHLEELIADTEKASLENPINATMIGPVREQIEMLQLAIAGLEAQKLKDIITVLRRAIITGVTHERKNFEDPTPPLTIYGCRITDAAWKLVPSDEPRSLPEDWDK